MRVLVTRPEGDAERTAAALAARGHEAVIAPVTVIVLTDAPPPGPFDALLLTSAHAVPALRSIDLVGRPAFAVGARTAMAARAAGVTHCLEAGGDAAALAALVQETLRPGARLLHAAAQDRKEEPARSLRAGGFEVLVWEVYRAEAVAEPPKALVAALRARRIDAALHFSRRSASLVVGLVERAELLEAFRRLPQLCLSTDVAAAVHSLGAQVEVAAAPREEALLDLVDRLADDVGSPSRSG
jgi:uroporphyrinogen-III synthase